MQVQNTLSATSLYIGESCFRDPSVLIYEYLFRRQQMGRQDGLVDLMFVGFPCDAAEWRQTSQRCVVVCTFNVKAMLRRRCRQVWWAMRACRQQAVGRCPL